MSALVLRRLPDGRWALLAVPAPAAREATPTIHRPTTRLAA